MRPVQIKRNTLRNAWTLAWTATCVTSTTEGWYPVVTRDTRYFLAADSIFKICKMEQDNFGEMFWVFINDFTAQNRWGTSKLVIKNQFKDPFIMKNFQACMRWAKYSRENTAVTTCEVSCVLSVMEFIFIQTWRLSLLGQPCNIL